MVNLIKSNKNNTLKSISNILDTVVDKNDYKLEFKNGLYLLNLKQSILIKVAKVLKENEKLKFNQFIDLTAVDYPNKKNRFEMVYILLSVEFNSELLLNFLLMKMKVLIALLIYFLLLTGMKGKFGIYLE